MLQEKKITVEASNIDEALKNVSTQWKIPVEELEYTVISEGKSGFLGLFGAKKMTVEVRAKNIAKDNSSPASNSNLNSYSDSSSDSGNSDLFERGIEFVNEILKFMDLKAAAVLSEKTKNTLDVQGEDAADYFVGRYGDALKGMEYIVNLSLRDPKKEPRIKIDSCGYRERRTKSLERLAEATARQAVKYGRPVRLDPMASWERWVIHTTLKNRDDVTTESVGETPMRKVVVMPKYDPDNAGSPTGPATMRIRARRERNFSKNNNSGGRNYDRSKRK